jgi:hypothetical protein
MRSASRRVTSSSGSPFRCIAGRYPNQTTTTTPAQIARFATGRPTSAAAAAATRIRDNAKSARLADYPASAALHPEPMLALAYDYVDYDDEDDDGDENMSSLDTTSVTSSGTRPPPPAAVTNNSNSSTIYPAPSAPQTRKAAGGGGGGAGGRYVVF